ncbi:hypothetical protein L916_13358 [Phytophthora nicotianae]|uniref:Uncharacterized protein n=1 Tax=Phytophthora nicotianae TaxID=4792 RepID=W2IJT7_PHYNI|nr:hypothetical protein L916_13358 [Phytophthora nicotianae]
MNSPSSSHYPLRSPHCTLGADCLPGTYEKIPRSIETLSYWYRSLCQDLESSATSRGNVAATSTKTALPPDNRRSSTAWGSRHYREVYHWVDDNCAVLADVSSISGMWL